MRVTLSSAGPSGVRTLALTAAGALVLLTTVAVGAEQATGQDCDFGSDGSGNLDYCNEDHTDGENGSSGGTSGGSTGGGGEPTCENLDAFIAAEPDHHHYYCSGENYCWENDPPFGWENEGKWPEPPSEDAGDYIYRYCETPGGEQLYADFTWSGEVPEEPPIEDQAEMAFGQLNAPPFTLAFSPPGESVIYIDTWWWADGAPSGNLEGSSAFGLIAIAQPDHMEVDPGDGTDPLTCDVVTTESDACTHTYNRASGDTGYPARARLVYDVHFEENGEPIDIPGAPDTFESPWQQTAVPVTEVQSIVR